MFLFKYAPLKKKHMPLIKEVHYQACSGTILYPFEMYVLCCHPTVGTHSFNKNKVGCLMVALCILIDFVINAFQHSL